MSDTEPAVEPTGGRRTTTPWWQENLWLLPAVFGVIATLYVMRHGVLFDPDSGGYVQRARAIADDPLEVLRPTLAGQVFNTGLHPPMYPVMLALASVFGGELSGARVLNVAALAVTLTVVALGLRRHCPPGVVLVVVWALVVSRAFLVRLHGFAMSDGLYLAFALGAIVALDRALDAGPGDRAQQRWLATVTVLTAAATLTRLVGVGLVLVVVAALLRPGSAARPQPKVAAVVGLASAAPLIVLLAVQGWTSRDLERLGGAWIGWAETVESGREVVRYLAPELVVRSALGTVLAVAAVLATLVGLVAIPIVWWMVRRRALPAARSMALTLVLFAWSQLVVVIVSRVAVDRFIWIDARHLMSTWVACAMALALWWSSRPAHSPLRARPLERAIAALSVTVLVVATITAVRIVTWPDGPWGNLRDDWGSSPIVAATRDTGGDTLVYTNRPDITLLLAGRDSLALPLERSPSTGLVNPDYGSQLSELCRQVQQGAAMVVLVDDLDPGWSMPEQRAEERLGVGAARRVEGGVVLVRDRPVRC